MARKATSGKAGAKRGTSPKRAPRKRETVDKAVPAPAALQPWQLFVPSAESYRTIARQLRELYQALRTFPGADPKQNPSISDAGIRVLKAEDRRADGLLLLMHNALSYDKFDGRNIRREVDRETGLTIDVCKNALGLCGKMLSISLNEPDSTVAVRRRAAAAELLENLERWAQHLETVATRDEERLGTAGSTLAGVQLVDGAPHSCWKSTPPPDEWCQDFIEGKFVDLVFWLNRATAKTIRKHNGNGYWIQELVQHKQYRLFLRSRREFSEVNGRYLAQPKGVKGK